MPHHVPRHLPGKQRNPTAALHRGWGPATSLLVSQLQPLDVYIAIENPRLYLHVDPAVGK